MDEKIDWLVHVQLLFDLGIVQFYFGRFLFSKRSSVNINRVKTFDGSISNQLKHSTYEFVHQNITSFSFGGYLFFEFFSSLCKFLKILFTVIPPSLVMANPTGVFFQKSRGYLMNLFKTCECKMDFVLISILLIDPSDFDSKVKKK